MRATGGAASGKEEIMEGATLIMGELESAEESLDGVVGEAGNDAPPKPMSSSSLDFTGRQWDLGKMNGWGERRICEVLLTSPLKNLCACASRGLEAPQAEAQAQTNRT